jgi:hypothetical protein
MRLESFSFWLGSALAAISTELHGNFSLTCSGVKLVNNSFLAASCLSPAEAGGEGPLAPTKLDLAMCIGLNQVSGHLQWEI